MAARENSFMIRPSQTLKSIVSSSTFATLNATTGGHTDPSYADEQKKASFSYSVDAEGQPVGLPLDLFIFCSAVKAQDRLEDDILHGGKKQKGKPNKKLIPTEEISKLPGHIPVTDEFHAPSNRERKGQNDDGLEDEDRWYADGRQRKVVKTPKPNPAAWAFKKSVNYDNIWMTKGEFNFPYRTYRPKVQVPFKGGVGQVPQAVVCERLHRTYRRTDINVILQLFGIEPSDLIPPPNYSENNERFYQEMAFRNRVRVNGKFKADFILQGKTIPDTLLDPHNRRLSHLRAPRSSSITYPSLDPTPSSSSLDSGPTGEGEGTQGTEPEEKPEETRIGVELHPFIKSKPPFGPMFPLNYFDNTEFDIRPPDEWISLGWDFKDKKFHPLPGKAFLPFAGDHEKKNSQALSTLAVDHLMTSTPRLNKIYNWLLKERYQRTLRMLGLNPDDVPHIPINEADLCLIARIGTTVPPLFQQTGPNFIDQITHHMRQQSHRFASGEKEDTSIVTLSLLPVETSVDTTESSSSSSKKESPPIQGVQKVPSIMTVVDSKGEIIQVRNVIRKRKENGEVVEEYNDDTNDDKTMASKSITATASVREKSRKTDKAVIFEKETTENKSEDDDDESIVDDNDTVNCMPKEALLTNDFTKMRPTSPDTDPFVDGADKFIMEFDKMKKVHVYDWKWVDVAVFDYNPKTEKYYVRSIYNPHIHAWVDKVYLCFDGEDPRVHGQRILDAVIRRFESENVMRFNLFIDCLPLTEFPSMSTQFMHKVMKKTLSTPKLKHDNNALEKAKKEIELEYKRTLAKAQFIQHVEKHPHLYKPWVMVPEHEKNFSYLNPVDSSRRWMLLQEIAEELPEEKLYKRKLKILTSSVRFCGDKEPREALKKIQEINLYARTKKLILMDLEPMSLTEWEHCQMENIEKVRNFLRREWMSSIVTTIHEHLGKISRSWFNLRETDHDVFLLSKSSKFLMLVKQMMEDTIRFLVLETLDSFSAKLKLLSSEIDFKRKFEWDNNDLASSTYAPPKGVTPIWTLSIAMEGGKSARYTQMLREFPKTVKKVFLRVIESVKGLPQLLPQIMAHMRFVLRPHLLYPEEEEEEIRVLDKSIQRYLKIILLPVDTYVMLYNKYNSVSEEEEKLREWVKKRHTGDVVTKQIELYKTEEEMLAVQIPDFTNITGFRVNVQDLKKLFIQKYKRMRAAVLNAHAIKLRLVMERISEEYKDMDEKLSTRSTDMSAMKALKLYTDAIPGQVEKLQEITMGVIRDYEVFDKYLFILPDEAVSSTWMTAVYAWTVIKNSKAAKEWLITELSKPRPDEIEGEGEN